MRIFLIALGFISFFSTGSLFGKTIADDQLEAIIQKQRDLEQEFSKENPEDSYYSADLSTERQVIVLSKQYERFIQDNPNYLEAYLLYGKFLRQFNVRKKAFDVFSKAYEIDPEQPVIHQQLGNYLAEEGQYIMAIKHFLKAIELSPETALYHYQLGELLSLFKSDLIADGAYSEQELDESMQHAFKLVTELDSGNTVWMMRYADTFFEINKPDWGAALTAWNEVIDNLEPSRELDIARLQRARVYLEMYQDAKALEDLQQVYAPEFESSRRKLLDLIDLSSESEALK